MLGRDAGKTGGGEQRSVRRASSVTMRQNRGRNQKRQPRTQNSQPPIISDAFGLRAGCFWQRNRQGTRWLRVAGVEKTIEHLQIHIQ